MNSFSSYNELQVLRQIAEGDEKAFRLFFDHYKDRFYTIILKMTRSHSAAEELVQEIFVGIWQKRELLNNVSHPDAYFITAVYRKVYRHYRKLALNRKISRVAAASPGSGHVTEETVLMQESQRLINEAIEKLPQQQQLVFRLSRHDGLSREEIAEQLHISPNTVRNHLADAIKFIRAYLKNAAIFLFISSI